MSEAAAQATYEVQLTKLRQELDAKKIKWTARMTMQKLHEKLEDWYDDNDATEYIDEQSRIEEEERGRGWDEMFAPKKRQREEDSQQKKSAGSNRAKLPLDTPDANSSSSSSATSVSRAGKHNVPPKAKKRKVKPSSKAA